jgi:hypothetical protein
MLCTLNLYHILTLILCNELSRRRSVLAQVELKCKLLICKRIFSKVNAEYIFKNKSTILECLMPDMFCIEYTLMLAYVFPPKLV